MTVIVPTTAKSSRALPVCLALAVRFQCDLHRRRLRDAQVLKVTQQALAGLILTPRPWPPKYRVILSRGMQEVDAKFL